MINYQDLIKDKVTMVYPECFETIVNHKENISKLDGDIVECGVWRGGFSIFLASVFTNKTIWVVDSFDGFQPLSASKYLYEGKERHHPDRPGGTDHVKASLEEVKANFKKYNLEEDRIKFLKGFVKDTLPNSNIRNISLLRIDVDAYSATLEVLDELYDKVVQGGYIIFDDMPLYETANAVRTFFKRRNIPPYVCHPTTDQKLPIDLSFSEKHPSFKTGCYIVK